RRSPPTPDSSARSFWSRSTLHARNVPTLAYAPANGHPSRDRLHRAVGDGSRRSQALLRCGVRLDLQRLRPELRGHRRARQGRRGRRLAARRRGRARWSAGDPLLRSAREQLRRRRDRGWADRRADLRVPRRPPLSIPRSQRQRAGRLGSRLTRASEAGGESAHSTGTGPTSAGVSLSPTVTELPSPSWLKLFCPQQITSKLLSSAQVWLPPAASWIASPPRLTTPAVSGSSSSPMLSVLP